MELYRRGLEEWLEFLQVLIQGVKKGIGAEGGLLLLRASIKPIGMAIVTRAWTRASVDVAG